MSRDRISVRLEIAFGLLIVLLVTVGWLGLRQMAYIHGNLEEIASKRWAKVQLARDAVYYSNLNNRLTMEIFLLRERADIAPLLARRADNTEKISALVKKIEEQVESARERDLLDNVNRARRPYIDSYLRGIDLLLNKQNYQEAQRNMVQDTLPRLVEYHNAWNAFVEFQGDQMDESARAGRRSYVAARRLALGLLISAILVAASIALFVTRSFTAEIIQRKRAQQDLARKATFVELLQVVAAAANEARSAQAAMQFTVERICKHTGWPVGHVYFSPSHKAGTDLGSSTIWHLDDAARFEIFRRVTERTPLAMGKGLPGRVAEDGRPAWIPDVNLDTNLPRNKVANDLGVKGAFAFPVRVQGEVAAVLEFFSSSIEKPDEELLAVMENVGRQLGQVVERTRAQEEIARKVEELARSNAELELFAYVASHDLQEPLRMVASYTQLLARRYSGKLGAEADEFIGFAVDGATRMQQLIQDLLSYSRVTTKGKALDLMPAEAACNVALGNLQETIKDSNAKVCVGPLPEVLADATQLTQLFQNLIGNAIKYRNERQPEIQVAAKSNGDHWVFSVQDNGIGIELQYFERIFQMFQRLHTLKDYSGTGIGLAVCRKIVERHGGRIWVESQPGQGSTFLFTIPRVERMEK